MPLVAANEMLQCAARMGFAAPMIEALDLTFLSAAAAAATNAKSPVVFSVRFAVDDDASPCLLAAAECAARRLDVPAAVCAEGIATPGDALRAVALGANLLRIGVCPGVSADVLKCVGAIVLAASASGVPVQADASTLPAGVRLPEYVEKTGVSSMYWPRVGAGERRWAHLQTLSPVPVVFEVAARQTQRQYAQMIEAGVCGLQLSAGLPRAALDFLRRSAMAHVRYPVLMRDLQATLCNEAERFLRVAGGVGRAAEVNAHCLAPRAASPVVGGAARPPHGRGSRAMF